MASISLSINIFVLKIILRASPSLSFPLLFLNNLLLKLSCGQSRVDAHVGDGSAWDVKAWAGWGKCPSEGVTWQEVSDHERGRRTSMVRGGLANMMSNQSEWGRHSLRGSTLACGARTWAGWKKHSCSRAATTRMLKHKECERCPMEGQPNTGIRAQEGEEHVQARGTLEWGGEPGQVWGGWLCGVRGDLPSIMGNQRASRASTGQWESRGMSNHCNPRKAR